MRIQQQKLRPKGVYFTLKHDSLSLSPPGRIGEFSMNFLRLLEKLSNNYSDIDCINNIEAEFHQFEPMCSFYCSGSPIAGSNGIQDKMEHGKTVGKLVNDELLMAILQDPSLQKADKFPEYCKNNVHPLIWECDPTRIEDKDEKRFFGLAADFGVTGGITIPIHQLTDDTYGNLTLFFNQKSIIWLDKLQDAASDIHIATLYLDTKLSSKSKHLSTDPSLSPRERDCLTLLAIGFQTSQIADRLVLADSTVSEYILNARKKLGARTRSEAVALAVQNRLIAP